MKKPCCRGLSKGFYHKKSFIYNYELNLCARFTPAKNRKPIEEQGVSFSEVVGLDLNELLEW